MLLLIKAIGFGFAVAAPVGPMSLICMRRTLTYGAVCGLATGAGIALADTTFAFAASLGLAALLADALHAHRQIIQIVAGAMVAAIGLRFWFSGPAAAPGLLHAGKPRAAFVTGYALTIVNPPTLLTFAALFAAAAPDLRAGPVVVVTITAGVLTGSMLWWIGLVALIGRLRHAIGPAAQRLIGRVSALCLIGFGIAASFGLLDRIGM